MPDYQDLKSLGYWLNSSGEGYFVLPSIGSVNMACLRRVSGKRLSYFLDVLGSGARGVLTILIDSSLPCTQNQNSQRETFPCLDQQNAALYQ